VCVRPWPDAIADHRGIHGELSWSVLVHGLARRLAALARTHDGRAFELDGHFALLVPPVRVMQVAYAADALMRTAGVGASVGV
jgi:hypothetical protein